jgi:hypothetical protein
MTGGSNKRVSVTALIVIKPGSRLRPRWPWNLAVSRAPVARIAALHR